MAGMEICDFNFKQIREFFCFVCFRYCCGLVTDTVHLDVA